MQLFEEGKWGHSHFRDDTDRIALIFSMGV